MKIVGDDVGQEFLALLVCLHETVMRAERVRHFVRERRREPVRIPELNQSP